MATYTTNLNLKKPGYTDSADIADVNANMDTLDAAVASKLGASDVVNNLTETVTGKALDATQGKALADLINSHIEDDNNPHGITKLQIGLGNVDNTSDINKPISTATQTALNAKAPLASPNFTGTPKVNSNMIYHVGNITISISAPGSALAEGAIHMVY